MKHFTLEHILAMHILVLKQAGGSDGLRDLGRIEAVIATQAQEVFGDELYVGVFAKAATLARGIVGDHPFSDGNKRTAMLTATTFLEINGIVFSAEKGELEDFAVQIATNRLDIPVIAFWFEKHTKKS